MMHLVKPALKMLALAGILALFIYPLFLLARTVNVL